MATLHTLHPKRCERRYACYLVITPPQVHAKAVLKDVEGAVPDEAPMMIWDDEIDLGWSEIEREGLREMGGFEARHSSECSHSEYKVL